MNEMDYLKSAEYFVESIYNGNITQAKDLYKHLSRKERVKLNDADYFGERVRDKVLDFIMRFC